jgi:hypothetical protein
MGLLIGLNLILVFLGYLLPLPSLVFAWAEFLRTIQASPIRNWSRILSWVGLVLLSCGVRGYLLLGAVGLLFFFGSGIGDLAI